MFKYTSGTNQVNHRSRKAQQTKATCDTTEQTVQNTTGNTDPGTAACQSDLGPGRNINQYQSILENILMSTYFCIGEGCKIIGSHVKALYKNQHFPQWESHLLRRCKGSLTQKGKWNLSTPLKCKGYLWCLLHFWALSSAGSIPRQDLFIRPSCVLPVCVQLHWVWVDALRGAIRPVRETPSPHKMTAGIDGIDSSNCAPHPKYE